VVEGVNWTLVVSATSLGVVIISSAVGVVWKLSRNEISMRAEAAEKFATLQLEGAQRMAAMVEKFATMQAEASERAAIAQAEALRLVNAANEKIYKVEIWARDEFVRKGSFEIVINRMEKGLGDLRGEIASRLDRMAERIERLGDGGKA
jgi:hypothetical protein